MSNRGRLILAVVASLLVAVAFFFLFVRPRQSELAEVRDSIEAEEQRTQALESELARLQDLQERAPELEASLARLRQLIPPRDQVANFIFLTQDAANASGVSFVQITPELPKPPPEGAAVGEIRVTIGAGGGYFAIQDFMRRMYDLDRAVRFDNISLSGGEAESGGELSLSGTARIFFEPPEAAAVPTEETEETEETTE